MILGQKKIKIKTLVMGQKFRIKIMVLGQKIRIKTLVLGQKAGKIQGAIQKRIQTLDFVISTTTFIGSKSDPDPAK